MFIIVPNESTGLTVLEEIDLRLDLLLKYIEYRSDVIAKNPKVKELASFNQWLCYNRYGSLATEDEKGTLYK